MKSRISALTNGVEASTSHDSELARVLDAYLAAVEAGQVVDPEMLAAGHPAIAERLRDCLRVLRVASRVDARADADTACEAAGVTELGDFRILRMIGRGGMGIVFEAEQLSLRRRVALKVLPFAAALDPQQLRRFEIEAQAAAQLHHTNIVPIFSVGCERGVHYYAMQNIKGQTLAAIIQDLRGLSRPDSLSTADATATANCLAADIVAGRFAPSVEALASPAAGTRGRAFLRTAAHLGQQAAEGLDHAHRLGIIHRDIKPANLLVDVRGNLWITDFGLARMQADSSLTMTGDILGTLRYTSPEQASPQRGVVDHRTDVYSLGSTLYELLTLHPAYDSSDRVRLLQQMAFDEPKPPRFWNQAVPRDLETIVLKALAKNVQNRYASARDLADDLRRFLEDRPINARRPSIWKRAARWARRHRTMVASVVVVLTLLAGGLGIITTQTRNSRRTDGIMRHARYVQDMRQAFHMVRQNRLPEVVALLARYRPAPAETDERSFPWYYLWRMCHFQPKTLLGHQGEAYHVEYCPDGKTLASCGQDGTVRIWDAATGHSLRTWRAHDGDVNYVTFSPDGRTLATGGDDGTVKLWDAASCDPISTLGKHKEWVLCVLFTPDGQRLVSSGRGGILKVWELETGHERGFPSARWNIEGMALSPDGRTLVTGGWNTLVQVWDVATLRMKLSFDVASRVQNVAFSHDGRSVATAGIDRRVRVWDPESGQLKATLEGHDSGVQCVTFSPDDRTIASASDDQAVRLWDVASCRLLKTYRGHVGTVRDDRRLWCVAFSTDGRALASCGRDSRINLWDLATAQDRFSFGFSGQTVSSLAFSSDSLQVAVLVRHKDDANLLTLDLAGQQIADTWAVPRQNTILGGAFSQDAERLATVESSGCVTLWDCRTRLPQKRLPVLDVFIIRQGAGLVCGELAFSANGRFLAITRPDNGVVLWDTEANVQFHAPQFVVQHPVFVPESDGRMFQDSDGKTLGDSPTGTYRRLEPIVWSRGVALSPDGGTLTQGAGDGTIEHWDINHLVRLTTLVGHRDAVTSLAWSPDGRILASASRDETVRLWDVATGQEVGTIDDRMIDNLAGLKFSPDGAMLAGYGHSPVAGVVLWPASRDDN